MRRRRCGPCALRGGSCDGGRSETSCREGRHEDGGGEGCAGGGVAEVDGCGAVFCAHVIGEEVAGVVDGFRLGGGGGSEGAEGADGREDGGVEFCCLL